MSYEKYNENKLIFNIQIYELHTFIQCTNYYVNKSHKKIYLSLNAASSSRVFFLDDMDIILRTMSILIY